MALVQIQLDQTQGAEQRFLQAIESDTRNWVARNSFGSFFVTVGVKLKGLGIFRNRWGIHLTAGVFFRIWSWNLLCRHRRLG